MPAVPGEPASGRQSQTGATFAGCSMGPYSGYGVVSSGGRVASECVSYGVDRSEGLFDAASQGVTTTEQKVQGRNGPRGHAGAPSS